jgi:DNA-binding NarL/FixJ family response regulator
VVIADDHPMMVEAVRATLTAAGLDVVGSTGKGAEVVDLVEATRPDVVLLDLEMPDRNGLDCLAALRERIPDQKVIVLSGADDVSAVDRALAMGAVCFVGKSVDPADLAATVRVMATKGPIYQSPAAAVPAQARASASQEVGADVIDLTRRELEILELVSTGMSNADLARRLWVTEQTVKFHLSNIYRKLGVGNRTHAAAKARALGLTSGIEGSSDGDNAAAVRTSAR